MPQFHAQGQVAGTLTGPTGPLGLVPALVLALGAVLSGVALALAVGYFPLRPLVALGLLGSVT